MKLPPMQTIRTNGLTLRAAVEGKGPLVVLVHGWPESWYSWRNQIPALAAAGYRACAIDVRGYGGSDKPHDVEAYDLLSITSDVAGVIDAMGESEAILVGHDWGAPIVWTTSILHRKKVRAVVGMSVPHLGRPPMPLIELWKQIYAGKFFYQIYFQEPGVAEAELEKDVRTALRKIYFSASGDGLAGSTRAFEAKGPESKFLDGLANPEKLPPWITEEDLDYYAGEMSRSGFRGPLNRYRTSVQDFERLPQLGEEKITQPALFIAGSQDPVLRFVPGANMMDAMDFWYTDLRGKVLVEGAGHWVQQERPKEVN
ncbi:MAG TPA: alpha/beta hydrolase, partial [Polyangiaceae bacterium]|nr:alpha/beta hydrolase [Polyangiaceae bacterium]